MRVQTSLRVCVTNNPLESSLRAVRSVSYSHLKKIRRPSRPMGKYLPGQCMQLQFRLLARNFGRCRRSSSFPDSTIRVDTTNASSRPIKVPYALAVSFRSSTARERDQRSNAVHGERSVDETGVSSLRRRTGRSARFRRNEDGDGLPYAIWDTCRQQGAKTLEDEEREEEMRRQAAAKSNAFRGAGTTRRIRIY